MNSPAARKFLARSRVELNWTTAAFNRYISFQVERSKRIRAMGSFLTMSAMPLFFSKPTPRLYQKKLITSKVPDNY